MLRSGRRDGGGGGFTLTTIRFSHYCEKARWALDRFRVPYTENAFLPLLHAPAVLKATRGIGRADGASTALSTPALLTDTGSMLHDSQDILLYANARFATPATSLYPTDAAAFERARQLEAQFHDKLGPLTRRLAYFHSLDSADVMLKLAPMNVGKAQAAAFRASYSWFKSSIKDRLAITPQRAKKDEAKLLAMLADAEAELRADAQRRGVPIEQAFLVGGRFSAADLTLACMLAPVMLVQPEEGYAARMASINEVGKAFRRLAQSVRTHAAGVHALRMFAEERGARVLPCTSGDLALHVLDPEEPRARL